MKPEIDYRKSDLQMGDLLLSMGVHLGEGMPRWRREKLKKRLERYMSGNKCNNQIGLDMGTFILIIQGVDEAGYLYQYIA